MKQKIFIMNKSNKMSSNIIPVDKWDEATRFLSTYKDGLAEDFEKKEDSINHKKTL